MHLARLHTHSPSPSLPFRQSSRISSQISVKCPSLSLSLNSGLRFRFSDVSFLRFRMEENTRAAVIGESPLHPRGYAMNPSSSFLRSSSSLSLSFDLHPKCLCSTISWLAISRYPLCSCPLCIPSIFRGLIGPGAGLYLRTLSSSLSLCFSFSPRNSMETVAQSLFHFKD